VSKRRLQLNLIIRNKWQPGVVVSALVLIKPRGMDDCQLTRIPSQCVTNLLGQLSIPLGSVNWVPACLVVI